MKWLRKAAEQGFAIGQSNLGVMYREGNGVPQDYTEAMKCGVLGNLPQDFSDVGKVPAL